MSSIVVNFFRWFFTKFSFLIPMTFKRLVLISTFAAKGQEEKVFNHIDYARLNKNLKIASSIDAIESALCLQNVVWKDISLQQLLVEASKNEFRGEYVPGQIELSKAVDTILDSLPPWIRYDRNKMIEDVKGLLSAEPISVNA